MRWQGRRGTARATDLGRLEDEQVLLVVAVQEVEVQANAELAAKDAPEVGADLGLLLGGGGGRANGVK